MSENSRPDGRAWDQLRPITITPGYQKYAEGSALIEMGTTKVLCAASLDDRVPAFMKGEGRGWVTAEYSMLPRATNTRSIRERESGKISGRSQEIQRLIGRSLRAITDLNALGERTVNIDCDVIQADGGTRTAAITGSYVALNQALQTLGKNRSLTETPLLCPVAAISVGIIDGQLLLDLCYEEDFAADVDFNVVLTSQGGLVEIQGATEADPFPRHQVDAVLSLASRGMEELFRHQREASQSFQ